MDGWMMGGWMDGWMDDGWMDDGWMDGWMDDGWMDGWMDDAGCFVAAESINYFFPFCLFVCVQSE